MNYDARIDAEDNEAALHAYNPLTEVDEEDRRSRRRMIAIGAVIALLLIAMWFAMHRGTDEAATGRKDQAATVTVLTPGRITIEGTISANGSLAARREMPVASVGEGGQVVSVLVDAGDWVRQGQVLAVIDRSVQSQQQAGQSAQIRVADADARLAQANLDRASKLVERGFVSKADIDRLTAARDAAVARVGLARAQYGQVNAQVARLTIVAPAEGLVLERRVEPGQVVSGGSGVLFRIAKGGEIEMKAMLGQDDLAKITPGATAEVTPVGSARPFTGQVWQVSPVIDLQTRQGAARIALSYAPELRPGGFASAVLKSGTVVAPMLPDSAILSDERGSYVYIVNKDNKIERRDIKTGLITDNGIAIIAGLSGAERVVMRAGGFLNPGETVKPVSVK